MVVSRSPAKYYLCYYIYVLLQEDRHIPIIPDTVDAALMQACVPLDPDCNVARTLETFSVTFLEHSPTSLKIMSSFLRRH